MPARPTQISLEPERRRALAADLFNHVWTLMESEPRTQRQTDLMIAAAYASRFFWEEDGEPMHLARGEWQISRACAVGGRPVAALEHAQRCLELCGAHRLGPFDFGYAQEALARAHQALGDLGAAAQAARAARAHASASRTERIVTCSRAIWTRSVWSDRGRDPQREARAAGR